MPPKNMTSVRRKIHIPRVEASFCCAAVSNCSRRARVSTWASANFHYLPDHSAVIVSFGGDDRDLVEVVGGRRRRRLPFESGSAPWIRGGHLAVAQRPHEVDHRHQVSDREHGGSG